MITIEPNAETVHRARLQLIKAARAGATDRQLVQVLTDADWPPVVANRVITQLLIDIRTAEAAALVTYDIVTEALADYPSNTWQRPVITNAAHHPSGEPSHWTNTHLDTTPALAEARHS